MSSTPIMIAADALTGADGRLDAAVCAAQAARLLSEIAAPLPLSSLTLEMAASDVGAGDLEAEVRIDKKTRAVAFTTLIVRRRGVLVFTARGLFTAGG